TAPPFALPAVCRTFSLPACLCRLHRMSARPAPFFLLPRSSAEDIRLEGAPLFADEIRRWSPAEERCCSPAVLPPVPALLLPEESTPPSRLLTEAHACSSLQYIRCDAQSR